MNLGMGRETDKSRRAADRRRMPAARLGRVARGTAAFTLTETLVVIAAILLLLAVLLPALQSAVARTRMLRCSVNLGSVAFKLQLFAEGTNPEGRGDSERLGRRGFAIDDSQEHLYRLAEFWDQPDSAAAVLEAGSEPMLCPAGATKLIRRRGFPCGNEAVGPPEDITLAVNMRPYRPAVEHRGGRVLAPVAAVYVPASILNFPNVPLLIDVDGEPAVSRHLEPFYQAPAVEGENDPYAGGRFWMPS